MLVRSLRLLLDGGGETGVTLSAFRPRDPDLGLPAPPRGGEAPVTVWEESEDGAVYMVSYRPPGGNGGSRAGIGGKEEEVAAVSRHPREAVVSGVPAGQVRALKAGSLPRMVRHLLEAPVLGDVSYVPAFLATYRSFAPTCTVLGLLLARLETLTRLESGKTPLVTTELHRSLSSLLCSWADSYPEDFQGLDRGLWERLLGGLRQALGENSESERRLLLAVQTEPSPAGGAPEEAEGSPQEARDRDPLHILGLQAEHVAAQLTQRDAELFLRLVPYECLGSFWSQRDKKGHEGACPSVRATVAQFNCVANAVLASCLSDTELRAAQRARLLEKWIHVAEECLSLRNFSSLYAVVSALQSSPVHRLKRTWEQTSRDAVRSYEELSTICSEQDNYSECRRRLFQKGTPRLSGTDFIPRRPQRGSGEQHSMGVVPYLGTFLKDLVMMDAATQNWLENGYINFEKRRKEFEILAQLRLLQGACRCYILHPDPFLQRWLQCLPRLTEAESHQLSCVIEPPGEGLTPGRPLKPTLLITHCTDLLGSVGFSSLVSWDQPSSPLGPPELLAAPTSRRMPQLLPCWAQHTKWPSVSALDVAPDESAPPSPEELSLLPTGTGFVRSHRRSASCGSAFPAPPSSGSSALSGGGFPSDCRIIRVRMELHNGSLYKSILVTSQDKTPAVIRKVLEKHSQDQGKAHHYELVQLLPEGRELAFPPSANIFYAMNGSSLDFVLSPKRPVDPPPLPPPPPPRPETSATFPKIKAKGRKLARALF